MHMPSDQSIYILANFALYASNPNLIRRHRRNIGMFPNIAHPSLYSERMLWRRMLDRNPLFVTFSDKLATKEYMSRVCPELSVAETLWVGHDSREIPDGLLKGDVFVKANHGCKFNYEIRSGQVDRDDLYEKTNRWLKTRWGKKYMEWGYSQVEPTLFVERAVGNARTDLFDIGIRASNGSGILGSVIGCCKVPGTWIAYLDIHGKPANGPYDPLHSPPKLLPEGVDISDAYLQAVEHSKKLSTGVDFARFDFLWNGTDLYGGEITIYPAAGNKENTNAATHNALISGWDLTQSHFLQNPRPGFWGRYARALRRSLETEPLPQASALQLSTLRPRA